MATFEQVHEWMAMANLVVFIGALLLILLAIVLAKRKKLVWHGNAMLVAMMISGLLLISHMGPSFISAVVETLRNLDATALMGVIHGIVGFLSFLPGIWLVGVWAFAQSGDNQFCFARKKTMWRVLYLWLISLGLGVLYYVLHISFG